MSSPAETTPVTIGTAGHIDHGKTLLVERLTGMRADRPHERERGMTIDIGYAEMRAPDGRRIGFVDLPGHERFVRNMIAGATGIDLALLVVAADDGVMPQTREHVEILGLLGVRGGIVVLNKIDLVDEETRLVAIEELRDFLRGTSLEKAPILPVSAATGEGIDALRDAILHAVADASKRADPGRFFMAVQRSFAAAGFGCIATGVPAAGSVSVGDELELLPTGKRGRVRSIEIYHEPAERARAGHRTAINVAGLHHDEVSRGMVLAEPGAYRPSRHIAAELRLLPGSRRPLRHAAPVRFLTGTLEGMAAVYLLEGDSLAPGSAAVVEIRTDEPVPVHDGDAFIVRTENATDTLGGGRIVASLAEPVGRKSRERREALLRRAASLSDPAARVREALRALESPTAAAVADSCQLRAAAVQEILEGMARRGEIAPLPGGGFAPAEAVAEAARSLRAALEAMHREQPLLETMPMSDARERAGLSEALLLAAIERLGGELVLQGRSFRLRSHAVKLDSGQADAAGKVLRCLREARFAPPAREELPAAAALAPAEVEAALTFLKDRGLARAVSPGVYYAKEVLEEGVRLLHAVARRRGSFEPLEAKTVFGGISRKWLIPLLEYYDRLGATRRDGNARIVTRRGETMAREGIDAQ